MFHVKHPRWLRSIEPRYPAGSSPRRQLAALKLIGVTMVAVIVIGLTALASLALPLWVSPLFGN
jgi:hypothetical protein